MLRFNKKTEYALLAVQYMSLHDQNEENPANTRDMAAAYHIPYPLLAKVMQQMANHGLVKSVQGTKGGYRLAKKTSDITVADVITIFDGPVAVAECFQHKKIDCAQWDSCSIKDPFYELNHKIQNLLTQTTVADLAKKKNPERISL